MSHAAPLESEKPGPLAGIRVVELGSFIAGPFAGQLLGDYGAEVIKIEQPLTGDPMRQWGITQDGESLWWPSIARNKQSVAIDLRDERGRELTRRLIDQVDVVIENFRPGRLSEWSMSYRELSVTNPGLVLVHVSGFGQTGPRASEAGFGSISEAVGGIRFTTGNPGLPPTRCGISLGDSLAALFAVIGAMGALNERHASGNGQEVDVVIYEAVASLMESTMADFELAGHLRSRTGSVLPGVAPSNVYPTADGSSIIMAANADTVFNRLCEAMGRSELMDDERFATHHARGVYMEQLDVIIGQWTSAKTVTELLDEFAAAGVPAGEIYSAPRMLADSHYQDRDMIVRKPNRDGVEIPMAGIVPKFSRTPGEITSTGPILGEHSATVLRDLVGLDGASLAELAEANVIEMVSP